MTRRRALLGGLLVALALLLTVSRFAPQVTRLEVSGHRHHSAEDILRLANVAPGDPFFWVTRQRVRNLAADPWIAEAWVVKRWPDAVAITIVEREPWVLSEGVVYARDGTPLPGASEAEREGLIQVSGWGSDRLAEALAILRQVEQFEAKVLSYSPAGFAIELAHTQLFTPNLDALRANWASFVSQQGVRTHVYPWGVSAAHD